MSDHGQPQQEPDMTIPNCPMCKSRNVVLDLEQCDTPNQQDVECGYSFECESCRSTFTVWTTPNNMKVRYKQVWLEVMEKVEPVERLSPYE